MAVTIDKILGKPLSHTHVLADIVMPGAGNINSTSITTVNGNTTLSTYSTILVNANSGNVTITLPAAASNANQSYRIKKIDSTSNTVTVDANGSETIDGDLTVIMSFPNSAMDIVSNGTSWYIV